MTPFTLHTQASMVPHTMAFEATCLFYIHLLLHSAMCQYLDNTKPQQYLTSFQIIFFVVVNSLGSPSSTLNLILLLLNVVLFLNSVITSSPIHLINLSSFSPIHHQFPLSSNNSHFFLITLLRYSILKYFIPSQFVQIRKWPIW